MDILFIQTEVESETFYQIKTGISFHVTRKLLIDDMLSLASGHLFMGFFPVKLKTNCNIKHSVVSGFFWLTRVDLHDRVKFLLLLEAKDKTGNDYKENRKVQQGILVFNFSWQAIPQLPAAKRRGKQMKYFFWFSMSEHLIYHMVAAQAEKKSEKSWCTVTEISR